MLIGGLQKTTLIDFPHKVACTVFTVGCNFRCPFCHNDNLVTFENFNKSRISLISLREFFTFLEKRKNMLDGVCITGGEPTINADLPEFIKEIKENGFLVKLDTNGTNPKMLKKLIRDNLLDFIAMDIKCNLEGYQNIVRVPVNIESIKESIKLILTSNLKYELRTTVVPGLQTVQNIQQLGIDIQKLSESVKIPLSNSPYFLQAFSPNNCYDKKLNNTVPFTDDELQELIDAVKPFLLRASLRGS